MVQVCFKIGTRASPLALQQTALFVQALTARYANRYQYQIVPISTSGDKIVDKSLADLGGKRLFTKELDTAVLNGEIDFAVHSLKDVEAPLLRGLMMAAFLPRSDPREAVIGPTRLVDLPLGAIIGSCSVRRTAQLLRLRSDLKIVPLRGNVNTRLRKVEEGHCMATLLAVAGLQRLNLLDQAREILEVDQLLPSAGQGTLVAIAASDNLVVQELLAPVSDQVTALCSEAERAFIVAMNGSCRSPLAAYAVVEGKDTLHLRGFAADLDDEQQTIVDSARFAEVRGSIDDPARLAQELAKSMTS